MVPNDCILIVDAPVGNIRIETTEQIKRNMPSKPSGGFGNLPAPLNPDPVPDAPEIDPNDPDNVPDTGDRDPPDVDPGAGEVERPEDFD
ncbi:1482_t:CDS:2 [Funneliformis geosporum]|uniref:1482_t:CDS:1 n=1 Tax=Funneliformis geosporum TaxID=1117311 RepID=A0A9W4SGW2_9GLOM|nr:1482_t:CDS:2 [Funneliformis geosporum]